ncbi:cystathionine beta-lyase [Herbaspirillum autotrophicum]|uniref:cystathionine beta-lyase n=1 Tax=Herbaspirillum autotrophicum TaxID=180195 RepID=UPI00067BEADF|nr:cystathionine beta-lyase [Herbaspirillum autotrophicum]
MTASVTEVAAGNPAAYGVETRLGHLGRDPAAHGRTVNTPIYRASTYVWPDTATQEQERLLAQDPAYRGTMYGRGGNPTTIAFEDAVAELEGGFRGLIMPSGLAAIVGAVLSVAKAGEHILVTDNVYPSARNVFTNVLSRYGIETSFFDPLDTDGIAVRIQRNTRALYLEAPGSDTFEVQDVPRIAEIAHAHGALVLFDNTWATPYFFKPFEHGVDISLHAATKYLVGHSDAMLGLIVARKEIYPDVRSTVRGLGYIAGPDDAYLALRGLRTLGVRLDRHESSAIEVAEWLLRHPGVLGVRHPAFAHHPGHATWQRDFSGSSGLFSFELPAVPKPVLNVFLDHLQLFSMGASWGGFESLVKLPHATRTFQPLDPARQIIRLHVGLETVSDLIADLDYALGAFAHAQKKIA